MSAPNPTANDAAAIVERQFRRPVVTVERFATGLKNWVYADASQTETRW